MCSYFGDITRRIEFTTILQSGDLVRPFFCVISCRYEGHTDIYNDVTISCDGEPKLPAGC